MIGAPLLALLAGCSGAQPETATPAAPEGRPAAIAEQPDLVLILVPGLRADPPGVEAAEAALLAGIEDQPTRRYLAAYSQSSAGFVSAGSLLTGRYPSAVPLCGLFQDGRHPLDEDNRAWCAAIPEGVYTLPETLGIYGYRTALFTAGFHGAGILAPEFQTWRDVSGLVAHRETPWEDLEGAISQWWSASEDQPRLAVVILPELMPACRPALLDGLGLEVAEPARALSEAERQRALGAYTDTARRAGARLGELVRDMGWSEDTWVAISSTNGLSLTETSGIYEDKLAFVTDAWLVDRTVRVPLALYGPGEPRPAERGPVELLDLFPTFAALAGAVPPAGLTGRDLLGGDTEEQPSAYSEFGEFLTYRRGSMMLGFRSFQHHPSSLDPDLTAILTREFPELHAFILHDVARDPFQRRPIEDRPQILDRLRQEMIAVRTGPASVPPDAMDAERLWQLRMTPSQGYW